MKRVEIVLLAAGASQRFGGPKLLAQYKGRPLIHYSLAAAQAVLPRHVTVVLGAGTEQLKEHLGNASIIENLHWKTGLSSSIAAGVAALPSGTEHLLLLLADQVLIQPHHLQQLLTRHRKEKSITCARYNGIVGIPAVFSQYWFNALQNLTGDKGARDLLRANDATVQQVEMPEAAVDIDSQEDLYRLINGDKSNN